MRFYTGQHRYYCGIDLHARTMYVCILEHETGSVVLHKNLRCTPREFLEAIAPYREDLVVAAECIFCWYWIADLCLREDIPFVLGHALYMKAIHGGKAKNDRIDARKIAGILRGGVLPMAYVYPQGMRATRDLLRRRLFFVRKRSELFSHIRTTFHQLNLPTPSARLLERSHRVGVAEAIPDPIVRASVEADLLMADKLDDVILFLEQQIRRRARDENPDALALLQTIHGVGPILPSPSCTNSTTSHASRVSRSSSPTRASSRVRRARPARSSGRPATRSATPTSNGPTARPPSASCRRTPVARNSSSGSAPSTGAAKRSASSPLASAAPPTSCSAARSPSTWTDSSTDAHGGEAVSPFA